MSKHVKKILFLGVFLLIGILGMSLIGYADESGPIVPPPWDYDNNDNIPGFVDKDGNPIPDIQINDNMILVDVYGHWAQEAITYCAKQGYLDGMLSRKYFFSPPSYIDKMDLVLLLGRKEGIDYTKYSTDYFSDVKLSDYDLSGSYNYSDWYFNFKPYYVNWAGTEGVLKGSGNGALDGGELNREQAATIIDRYIEKFTSLYDEIKFDKATSYKDHGEISGWAKESIERLSNVKLFNGDEKGNFNPKKEITRAEICQIIYNISKL